MGYVVEWDGVVEKRTKKFAYSNVWRVEHMGFDALDLYQEAWFVFDKVKGRYGKTVVNEAHFLSLYIQALEWRTCRLSRKSVIAHKNVYEFNCVSNMEVQQPDSGSYRNILEGATKEIKEVLTLIFDTPTDMLEALGIYKQKRRVFLDNDKLCYLLGYTGVDLLKCLKDYLATGKSNFRVRRKNS